MNNCMSYVDAHLINLLHQEVEAVKMQNILYNRVNLIMIFQLWYETCTNISAGTELVLGPREALNLQDMFGDTTSADEKSDRETGIECV